MHGCDNRKYCFVPILLIEWMVFGSLGRRISIMYLLCIGCGFISGFGLTYGVIDEAGVSGGVGLPGTGLC